MCRRACLVYKIRKNGIVTQKNANKREKSVDFVSKKVYSIQALNERASQTSQRNEKVLIGRKKCLTGWRVYGILIELPLRNQRKTQECLKKGWKNFLTKWNACVKLIKLLLQNSDDIKRKVLIRNEKSSWQAWVSDV